MEVDVLITGVTGFVGRFVLLDFIKNKPNTKIGVVIRPLKNKSPIERFHEEILYDTMFSKYIQILSKVNVIGASIEDIEKTSLLIKTAHCIIHCAANVKHYDPFDKLVKDNVTNVKTIINVAELLNCNKLILLSTCYVHPKSDTAGNIQRIPKSTRESFYNDYCYTKWLGEEEVFNSKSTIKEINIVRLSCVGAPLSKHLQSHPFSAQAHLGILSLASRGYITAIGLTHDARLSIIPVDLVSKYILSIFAKPITDKLDEPILHQVCPPKNLDVFHPNLINTFSIAQYELNISSLRTVLHDGESPNYLPPWYSFLRLFSKKIDKFVNLHDKIQEFVLLFTSQDIRFNSSLPLDFFPNITEKEFLLDTYNFCIRNAHQLQFKKGVPLSLTDKFWHKMGNKEPVQLCCTLSQPFKLTELEKVKENVWALMTSNRKFTAVIQDDRWVYRPGLFESHFGIFEFSDNDTLTESLIINKGLNKYTIDNIWHCDLIVQNNFISHVLLQFDHGVTDGIGLIKPIVNKTDYYVLDKPIHKFVPPPTGKKLNIFEEVVFCLSFMAILTVSYLFKETYSGNRVSSPSVATNTIPIYKHPKFTYTTDLLWRVTKSLAKHTKHEHFILCVPSVISVSRSADKIINNNFVPILLPVTSTMTELEFYDRCRLLKSKCILFLMYCIQELITIKEWWWLRDKIMSKVSAVVSSVNLGENMPSIFSAVHVATTTPAPILYCVTAFSNNESSFITVRSQDSFVPASKILEDIC